MRCLVADDHPLVRDALARALRQLDDRVDVVECGDLPAALRALQAAPTTLAMIDLHMPGMQGVDSVRALCTGHPTVRIVVASGDEDPAVIRDALDAGAAGYLPKSERPEVLQHAIRLVLDGGTYLPGRALLAPPVERRPAPAELTPRQTDVLRCLMRGEPNKVIARALGLTEGTVKIHIAAILRAFQARNRTEAVVRARAQGLGED